MSVKKYMSKRTIRITTALALVAVMAVIAVSLLMTGAGGATAFNAGGSDTARHMPIPAQYTAQCSNGVAVPDPDNNPGLVSDCAALLASKETLEGTTGNLNWSADVAISDWNHPVYIDDNRVSALHSINANLNGEIPAELGNLSNLNWLWLSGSQLTGNIPAELGNLSNLRNLNLSDNQLTGEIPPELGNLSNLNELRISENQLTGEIPRNWATLPNLTGLSLAVNQLTGEIPPELGNLANLTSLNLGGNQLTGKIPPELGNLANLEYLHLYVNELTGAIPPELGNIPNLRELELYDGVEDGNQFTGCIPRSLRAPLGDVQIARLELPICAATAADRIAALETQSAEQASVIDALQAQLAEHANRLAALESASATAPTATPSPTPTATPSPTPTSVAGTSGDDACITALAGDASVTGNWTSDCLSANPSDNRTYYARFYTFILSAASEATITLSSTDAAPYLFLREGTGTDGAVNQENGSATATTAAITATLQPGAYTIEASTWEAETPGNFTLALEITR